jgi:energy-coupling factor transport system ATP-binding protein
VVEEDVAFGPENLGIASPVIRQRVDSALRQVGMYDYREHAPHLLSGGQKQRIAIAGIIAMQPKCIVLDQPTAMLDPRGRREVMETVLALNREKGITVVLITHDMHLMLEYTPRALVFHAGKVIADQAAAQVLNAPEIVEAAHLKETSLYHLSALCGIADPEEFTRRFIARDREVRK